MSRIEKLERILFPLSFVFALVYSVWAASQGWWNTIMDEHSFRQTQTAITSFYMLHGGPFWKYETPLFGPPWSIPFEFPLYQWLVAVITGHTHFPMEQMGRLVGKFFYYAALWPFWSILGTLRIAKNRRLLFLSLYLLSPMYLYWSRCFLIESTALFFSILYLASVGKLFSASNQFHQYCGVAIFGVLAGVLKATTFASFLAAAGIWFLYSISKAEWRALPKIQARRIFDMAACFLIPLVFTLLWTHFTDLQKMQNPIAEFISSERLSKWNFGTLHQRISPSTWYMFFRKTIHDAIGHRTTWMLSILFMLLVRNRCRLYVLCTLLFLVAPMTFTNLHIAHNYYWYANGIFLIFALGVSIVAMLESKKAWPLLGCIFFLAALSLSVRQYQRFFYFAQTGSEGSSFPEMGREIQKLIPENGVLLIYGWDWYPALPYYAQRRTIMNRENLDLRGPEMRSILGKLEPYQLTHFALCNGVGKADFLAKLAEQGLHGKLVTKTICDIYQIY